MITNFSHIVGKLLITPVHLNSPETVYSSDMFSEQYSRFA